MYAVGVEWTHSLKRLTFEAAEGSSPLSLLISINSHNTGTFRASGGSVCSVQSSAGLPYYSLCNVRILQIHLLTSEHI